MKIVITRPRNQTDRFAAELRAAGHEVLLFPVITIRPLDDLSALDAALRDLARYAWVIFTSVNTVEIFWNRLSILGSSFPQGVKVAAIGPKTAAALRSRGAEPAFTPGEAIADTILPGLGDVCGKRLLLPQAEIARPTLAEAIAQAGGMVDAIPIYHTLPAEPYADSLAALANGVDVITFTSPSTVANFIAIARRAGFDPARLPGDPVFACIGPVTQQAAEDAALPNLLVADEHTIEGLLKKLDSSVSNG